MGMEVLFAAGLHFNQRCGDVLRACCVLGNQEVGRDVVPPVATGGVSVCYLHNSDASKGKYESPWDPNHEDVKVRRERIVPLGACRISALLTLGESIWKGFDLHCKTVT